jgi:cell division GTPase FtsZ
MAVTLVWTFFLVRQGVGGPRSVEVTVKPVGRAVEIVAVGLGQAGGNLAAELYRRGYRAMALNTATTDLSSLSHRSTLLPEEFRVYIGVEGHDGAGADLAYGRECVVTHAAKIRERVAAHTANADIVLLTAGLGGGTGSAVSELIRVLAELELPIIVLATLPSEHESGIAKVNAVRAISELVKENVLGWLFVDNSRLARNHGDVSLDRYYPEINKIIMEPLDALNHLNSRNEITPIRSLDGEDIRSLMLSSGIMSFVTTTMPKLTGDGLIQAVRDGLLHNSVQPEGFQLENISYLGLVIEAPESMLADTPFTFFEQINEQLKDETGGAGIYMGVYRLNVAQPHATIRLFASSQSLPDGVQEMVGQAKREGGQLRAKLQRSLTGLDLGEIEEYELFRTSPGAMRRRVTEGSDRPARTSNRPPPPPAPRASAMGMSAAPRVGGSVSSSPAINPSIPPRINSLSPHANAPMPDRDAYDQLVKEFKEADSADVKKRVSERLEKDQKSDNSLIRYYAVRAMSKLDSELFASALESATQDEDATVRAVAMKALNRTT